MKAETIPGFDCLEFKWKAQSDIYEKIKDMTVEEQIAFFRDAAETGPFADLIKAIGTDKTAPQHGAGGVGS